MKDVGIVMPVYKQVPRYLNLAIRSVLKQSYRNFHLVIVSDGAPSETVSLIKRVVAGDPRVHLIVKEQNQGVAKALNTGFDHIMTLDEVRFLTWVSSDNIYYPNYIERLRIVLKSSPENVGLSYSCFRHIDADGNYLTEPSLEDFKIFQSQPREKLIDSCFIGVSFMYRKKFAQLIKGYQVEPVEDYEYWLRLTEVCDIVYLPDVLMEYRTNSPLSISAQLNKSKSEKRRWRYYYQLVKQQARTRRNIPPMLSIIIPVESNFGIRAEQLEFILEQSFSNFNIYIIDLTQQQKLSIQLQHIKDPRISFYNYPKVTKEVAIRKGLKLVNSPLTIIYGKGDDYSKVWTLNNLVNTYHASPIKGSSNAALINDIKSLKTMTIYKTNILKRFMTRTNQRIKNRNVLKRRK